MHALSFRLCSSLAALSLLSVPSAALAASPQPTPLSRADVRILRQIAPVLPTPAHAATSVAPSQPTGALPAVWSTVSNSARRGLALLAVLVIVITALAVDAAAARRGRPVPRA